MTTTKLLLPELTASQSQKHVTHNEALAMLDTLVQLSVADKDLTSPPGSPSTGDAYIVAATATGDWASKEDQIAVYDGDGWIFHEPNAGWLCWVDDESDAYRYSGSSWAPLSVTPRVTSDAGAVLKMGINEELLSGLSGASVATTIVIPTRCVLLGVATRTVTSITGATSYDCGPTGGSASAYGGSLSIAAGSTNIGVIDPTAFYSDTTVTLTANGGNFTAGAVRVSIQYIQLGAATS
ncbi:MAG: putative ribonuclease III [Prokaryotic dsDNA virus sp.]|nr:MAG: putative ribonuclease III [Prokaryotic dsDNA virus sp.]|tara:strand:+ start:5143 stop:5856 length:714 start_codon:yes stop_codon:yes gene_type:complete